MNRSEAIEKDIGKQLIFLAMPLLLGDIFQQFYNMIDAVVVGRYVGEEAFAAIGIAGTVMNLFIFLLGGCCTGISILLAQLYGQENESGFRQERFIALTFGAIFSVLLGIGAIFILPLILRVIQTPTSLLLLTQEYLDIIFAGLLVSFLYNLNAASLRAVGNTKMVLVFLMFSILLNIALDILFVSCFQWGIRGAAIATVLAQGISAANSEWYYYRYLPHLFPRKADCIFRKDLLMQTIKFGSISAMQQSSLYIGKMLVQGSVNHLGLGAITAYTAAGRIEGFINSFGNSGSDAISIFVAQRIGAGRILQAKAGFRKGFGLLLLFAVVLSGGMYFFAEKLLLLLIGASPQAMIEGKLYLQTIALFYFLCFIGCAFVGWYRGRGMVQVPFVGTTLHISMRALLSVILSRFMGLQGVAVATGLGWICVVTFHSLVYLKKCDMKPQKTQ